MTSELERQLSKLGQGEHLCPIHENLAEEMASAVFFMKTGLARGDRCLYIADDRNVEALVGALTAGGINVPLERERGALRFLTTRDIYRKSGAFDPHEMIQYLRETQAGALADGFSGLRVVGEMSWALGPEIEHNRLIEYEALLNDFSVNSRSVVLCQYNRERFSPAVIHDVLLTHPLAIIGDLVCPNPLYYPPDLVLRWPTQPDSELLARRVDWRIRQLKETRRAAQEREDMLEHLQALSRRLLEVQEEERRHLARELHDEVGQMLTALGLILKTDGTLTADTARAGFEKARVLVDELLEMVRQLSFDLRPAALDQLGLRAGLFALFERYTRQTGVLVDFKHQDIDGRFAPEVETTAYRIVQEALTNVARHAGVAGVTVRVWTTEDRLSVQIEDRGRGFDPEAVLATPRSSGLVGMQERATLLGGRLTIESRPGIGTQITAELPLSRAGGKP